MKYKDLKALIQHQHAAKTSMRDPGVLEASDWLWDRFEEAWKYDDLRPLVEDLKKLVKAPKEIQR